MSESNKASNHSDNNRASNLLLSKPAVFLLGVATSYVLGANGLALRKAVEPLVTGTIKQGIRVTRSVKGTASQVSATIADSYAKAAYELEQEERQQRAKSGPRVVSMEEHQDNKDD